MKKLIFIKQAVLIRRKYWKCIIKAILFLMKQGKELFKNTFLKIYCLKDNKKACKIKIYGITKKLIFLNLAELSSRFGKIPISEH